AELLGLPRVGRHDNFFALGGHSLLAVQLIERLRRRGIGLAIKDLFQHPTLSGLATRLAQPFEVPVPPNAIAPNAPAITPAMLPLIDLAQDGIDRIVATVPGGVGNVQDIYALSPLQDGILFHHLLDPGNDPYLLRGHLLFDDRDTLERYLEVMQALVARHDILRTAFVWDTLDAPAQVVWRHARTPVMEPALDPAGGPIAEQLMWRFDTQRYRMDLTLAPLLHFAIAEEPGRGWHAVMLLHHLVGDHTTLAVLHSEVQAFMTGAGASLPAPLPYRHLVAQARLGMPDEEHDAFFRAMLQDVSVPTHPFGIARIERSAPAIGEARLALPASLDERLRAHARRLGVSLAAICHLSWAVVLSRVSATRQVVFGTVLFGRMTAGAGADRTMGLYINTLPLRLDVGDTQVEQAIRETQLQLAALLAHEHASLALAQRCSAVPPNVPLFGALLNYRHDASPSDGRFVVPGMTFLGGHERTHYPLVLSIEDDGASLTLAVQAAESISPERVGAYMAQSLAQLADALDGAAPATLDRLSVVPEHERHLL
ncbi:condensation domain-containing protein, partial [Trinickia caryophylli]